MTRRLEDGQRERILERDGHTCRYCGNKRGPFHLDHVYPYVKGGETSINNIVTACEHCNTSKGSKAGIYPMPIGYFEPKPNRLNINLFLLWGIADLIIAFVGMFNGGGVIPLIFFAASLFQLTVGMIMVFKNVRFDELFQVEDDETE